MANKNMQNVGHSNEVSGALSINLAIFVADFRMTVCE